LKENNIVTRGVRVIIDGVLSKNHPEYQLWQTMRRRCEIKNRPDYPSYGGKGITYQESWKEFKNFIKDMGPRKDKNLSLDRIDSKGNYTKENCRWATSAEQSDNRRIKYECLKGHPWTEETTIITHNGAGKTRRCKICYKKRMSQHKKKKGSK